MQFYIIHEDPVRNVELLPEYALKKVNVREGWQILSDIGHIHGVTWEGQNKLYSASHVLTRSFCQNQVEFLRFIKHYAACVDKLHGNWKYKYAKFLTTGFEKLWDAIPEIRTREMFNIEYLLTTKYKHLTAEEMKKLYDQLEYMKREMYE